MPSGDVRDCGLSHFNRCLMHNTVPAVPDTTSPNGDAAEPGDSVKAYKRFSLGCRELLRRDGPGRASGMQSLRGSTKTVRGPRFLAVIRPVDRDVDVFHQLF